MLEFRNVNLARTGRLIFDQLSLIIPENKLVVLTGANGSGKSSLASLIMGITKPNKGEIFFKDKNITKLSSDQRAKLGIAYAFQQNIIFKGLSVFDLLFLASERKISLDEAKKILERVGLGAEKYLNRELNRSLSGGEAKRIELASALARNADLLIFDEPEAGIDLWSFDKLSDIFQDLRQQKKSLLIISHQEKVLRQAELILLLENSKIKKFETHADFKKFLKQRENHDE